jgi:hypothetical protein
MSKARQNTIEKFTNLLDGSIIPSASIGKIIDYYEAQLKNIPVTVKKNCSITKKFIEAEIAEIEEDDYNGL